MEIVFLLVFLLEKLIKAYINFTGEQFMSVSFNRFISRPVLKKMSGKQLHLRIAFAFINLLQIRITEASSFGEYVEQCSTISACSGIRTIMNNR